LLAAEVSIAGVQDVATASAEEGQAGENEAGDVEAGEGEAEEAEIHIADEPKTIDPAELMPPQLAEKVTVDLTDATFADTVDWLREERGLLVHFDERGLEDTKIMMTDPINERLSDEPLYFLFDRLRPLGFAWLIEDNVIRVMSYIEAWDRLTTQSYMIGDLLDAGYKIPDLDSALAAVDPDSWAETGSVGSKLFLGDILFVLQTDDMHRQVSGLLEGLRRHGRRTFTYDPPQHERIREILDQTVSVDFRNTPLSVALNQLSRQAEIEIRLDRSRLREAGVGGREPVTLTLSDRKLSTTLNLLLAHHGLHWIIDAGMIWVTSSTVAEEHLKPTLFDVRDLARTDDDVRLLIRAVEEQTSPDSWESAGGVGGILFPRTGVMMVVQTEPVLDEVERLLEAYRVALRQSRPREREAPEEEVTTRYYRMESQVAEALVGLLPELVEPESWSDPQRPDAPGTIQLVPSARQASSAAAATGSSVGRAREASDPPLLDHSVLIIEQRLRVHRRIGEVIRRVTQGDPLLPRDHDGGMGGMGGMMGGMGGMGMGGMGM
jgi:hypothetical protein